MAKLTPQKFQEFFCKLCQAIEADKVKIGDTYYWCPWAPENSLVIPRKTMREDNVIKGLKRQRVLKAHLANTVSGIPESWRNTNNFFAKDVFEIKKPETLSAYGTKCPVANMTKWINCEPLAEES